MLTVVVLVLGTLVSEDLTCITAGLLIQRGELGLTSGIVACTAGIFAGDMGLWLLGRLFGVVALRARCEINVAQPFRAGPAAAGRPKGRRDEGPPVTSRRALSWPWAARALQRGRAGEMRAWLGRHAAAAIVGSRFLPGTRLPLYLVAGIFGFPGRVFAIWALVGSLLWTPTLVLLTAAWGDAFVVRMRPLVGVGWGSALLAAAVAFLLLRLIRIVTGHARRRRMGAHLARWARWEFWPMWLFYAPVGLWVLCLAVRHRGISTMTAANPGIPDGGTVGESKFDILSKLPGDCVIPSLLVSSGSTDRLSALEAHMESAGWRFPIVLKPDVGQRGAGVKLVRGSDQARRYLSSVPTAVIAQPYHQGPFEAGVFYYRMPWCRQGRILSITDKHFPVLVGDGVSTVEDLIWTHPRYRLQADTFVARHHNALTTVLGAGERLPLGIAGNHCQGTMFRDGAHLITPALTQRIDAIARRIRGFFVGRFDVRYSDIEAFKAGTDLSIVELNGATAESTNIYDPQTTLVEAYRQLFRQWSIVFAIGAANRATGAQVTTHRRLFELVRAHLSATTPFPVSD